MPTPSLRELQHWMKARIAPAGAPASGARASGDEAGVRLQPQRGVPGEARLAVYAGGYRARTREALAEVYEAVRYVTGETVFGELAHAYAAHQPSRAYNLAFVGHALPTFLAGHPVSQRLPFLPDLARLEWLICQAFHAFDHPPLDPGTLADRPLEAWARTRLRFQPSVSVIASSWPILDIWQARLQSRKTLDLPVSGRPQAVLVSRHELQTRCGLLDPAEHAAITRLLEGQTLGEACAALPDAELPVAAWFARWAAEGLLVAAE